MSSNKLPPPTGMPPPTMAPTKAPRTMTPAQMPSSVPPAAAPTAHPGAPPAPSDANLVAALPTDPAPPAPVLTSEKNVAQWPLTPGYQAFMAWLKRRCDRIRGQSIRRGMEGVTEKVAL